MLSKKIVRLLPAAIGIILALSMVQQAHAEFSFSNQFSYVDDAKIMHVLGEITNNSDAAMRNILLTISFYDNEDNLLDEFQRVPALWVINPDESSPFEILYVDSQKVGMVANYTVSATGQETEQKEKQLKIISSNSRLDVLGTYYINAAARNDGQETASNVVMIATLYDRDGRVVAIGNALAEAGPGSSNITAGSQAGFGFAITEKLQTYKTARYSLIADSDQYASDAVVLQASGPGLSEGNQTQSGCLIATAAFGSELAPQVQQLRLFRDGIALKTSAGSSFMNVFNAWYYSFSPSVADYERQSPWLQGAVRTMIYPLLGILAISTSVYDSLDFSGELGIVAAGMTASSLVGMLYFAPLGAAIGIAGRKRQWNMSGAGLVLACAWAASVAAIAIAEIAAIRAVMMFGTSLLVLSAISTVVIVVARAFRS
ncbi:MAG TPA: CFI-box-CTERM domain-containing protein [Nitrososphaera sp.]|nr:CFI-box-CTERM domain-containing protein [Nitrososphaera sp.]